MSFHNQSRNPNNFLPVIYKQPLSFIMYSKIFVKLQHNYFFD